MSPGQRADTLPEANSSKPSPFAELTPQTAELVVTVPAGGTQAQLPQAQSERPPPTPTTSNEAPPRLPTDTTVTDSSVLASAEHLAAALSVNSPAANGTGTDLQQQLDQEQRGASASQQQQQKQFGGWQGVQPPFPQQQPVGEGQGSSSGSQQRQPNGKEQGAPSASQKQQQQVDEVQRGSSESQQPQQLVSREEGPSASQQPPSPQQVLLPVVQLQPQSQSNLSPPAAVPEDPTAGAWPTQALVVPSPEAAAAAAAPGMQAAATPAADPPAAQPAKQQSGMDLTDHQLQQGGAPLGPQPLLPASAAANLAAVHLAEQLQGVGIADQLPQQGGAALGLQPPAAAAATGMQAAAPAPVADAAAAHLVAHKLSGADITAQLPQNAAVVAPGPPAPPAPGQQAAAAATGIQAAAAGGCSYLAALTSKPSAAADTAAPAAAPAGPDEAAVEQPQQQPPAAELQSDEPGAPDQSMAAPDVPLPGASTSATAAASTGMQAAPAVPDPGVEPDAEQHPTLPGGDPAGQHSQDQQPPAPPPPPPPPAAPAAGADPAAQPGGPFAVTAAGAGAAADDAGPFGATQAARVAPYNPATFGMPAAAGAYPAAQAGGPFTVAAAGAGAAAADAGPFGAAQAAGAAPYNPATFGMQVAGAYHAAPGGGPFAAAAAGAGAADAGPFGAAQAPAAAPYNPANFGMVAPNPQVLPPLQRLRQHIELQERLARSLREHRSRPLPLVQQPLPANELLVSIIAAPIANPAAVPGRHVVDPSDFTRHAKGLAVKQAYDLYQAVGDLQRIAQSRQALAAETQAAAATAEQLAQEVSELYGPRPAMQQLAAEPEPFGLMQQQLGQALPAVAAAEEADDFDAEYQALAVNAPPLQQQQQPPEEQEAIAAAARARQLAASANAAAAEASAALATAQQFASSAATTVESLLEIRVCNADAVRCMDGLQLASYSKLGDGSFARVFCGFVGSPVLVAVKRFNPGFGSGQRDVGTMFMREVQLQAIAASDPNVINITAICFDPLMIVMEQCDTCLADYLSQRTAAAAQITSYTPYSWPVLVDLASQAAAALAYLHRTPLGILHNDVRALNMLLTSPSQQQLMNGGKAQLTLQLCDFGIAEFVGTREEAVVPSVTDAMWLPPELKSPPGDRRVSKKTDVFALGCVLDEMMIGPYTEEHRAEQPTHWDNPRQMPAKDKLLSALRDTAPPQDFAGVYKSCLQSEAVRRPTAQTVKGWLDDSWQAG